jgi:hypothetical protein
MGIISLIDSWVSMAFEIDNSIRQGCKLPEPTDFQPSTLCEQCTGLIAWIDERDISALHKSKNRPEGTLDTDLYRLRQIPCPSCHLWQYIHNEERKLWTPTKWQDGGYRDIVI